MPATTAVGYIRQSRKGDVDASPESQRVAIQAYALAQGLDLVAIEEDVGKSGWSPDVSRPGLDAALALITEGKAEALIVRDLSRLSRRGLREALAIIDRLDETGATLVSVAEPFLDTSNPIGQAVFALFAAFARQDSDIKSQKVKEAKAVMRERGAWQGGPVPVGLKVDDGDDRLTVNEVTAPVMRQAVERMIDGGSLRSTAKWLDEQGQKAQRGGAFRPNSLLRWCRSIYLVGWVPDGGGMPLVGDDGMNVVAHEQLLTVQKWTQLQAALDRNVKTGPLAKKQGMLLRGLIYCGYCGGRMTGNAYKDKTYYRCTHNLQCAGISIAVPQTDLIVAREVAMWLSSKSPSDPALDAAAKHLKCQTRGEDVERVARLAVVAEVSEALDRLDGDRADGLIEGERYTKQVTRLQVKLTEAQRAVGDLGPEAVDLTPLLDPLAFSDSDDLGEALLENPAAQQIINAVVDTVTIHPRSADAVRGTYDYSRVDVEFTPRAP